MFLAWWYLWWRMRQLGQDNARHRGVHVGWSRRYCGGDLRVGVEASHRLVVMILRVTIRGSTCAITFVGKQKQRTGPTWPTAGEETLGGRPVPTYPWFTLLLSNRDLDAVYVYFCTRSNRRRSISPVVVRVSHGIILEGRGITC